MQRIPPAKLDALALRLEEIALEEEHIRTQIREQVATFGSTPPRAEKSQRFVVRGWHERRVQDDRGRVLKVQEFVSKSRVYAKRSVKLSPRKRQIFKQESRRRAQSREGRVARLVIRAEQVEVMKPSNVIEDVPTSLALNVVYVREVDSDVIEPVDWLLYTTEPIESQSDVLRIVDIYRARWVIEEFFKALKTGCAFEKRQLESFHTLQNALALFIPLAWGLLRLRVLARQEPNIPADQVLTPTQITILRKKKLLRTAKPTAQHAMLAVAALGGHIVNNGSPGWIVLGRGYEELRILEAGFLLASTGSDQS